MFPMCTINTGLTVHIIIIIIIIIIIMDLENVTNGSCAEISAWFRNKLHQVRS